MLTLEIGSTFAEVEILQLVKKGKHLSLSVYLIKLPCCGSIVEMTYGSLARRKRKIDEGKKVLCSSCNGKKTAERYAEKRQKERRVERLDRKARAWCEAHSFWKSPNLRPDPEWTPK